jgi:hypothetical protein
LQCLWKLGVVHAPPPPSLRSWILDKYLDYFIVSSGPWWGSYHIWASSAGRKLFIPWCRPSPHPLAPQQPVVGARTSFEPSIEPDLPGIRSCACGMHPHSLFPFLSSTITPPAPPPPPRARASHCASISGRVPAMLTAWDRAEPPHPEVSNSRSLTHPATPLAPGNCDRMAILIVRRGGRGEGGSDR